MFPSILNKSRTLISKSSGSETQRLLSSMIYDDDVNVLTTFDMNRVASLTFGEAICGEIFDVLEHTLCNPQNFSLLSLHKVLVLMHHLAIYASQKAANTVWILRPRIKELLEYNTVLIAHADPNSILSRIQRIKGGSVDRGQPIREAAKMLDDLLSDVELFRQIRASSADPDSLVPLGHHEEVGFVSDHVRKAMLEEKIKKQHAVDIKSNLKGNSGFGAGAESNVIGAAHSMEDMLKMAMKDKIGYRDGEVSEDEKAHFQHLQQLQNELQMKKASGLVEDGSAVQKKDAVVDLLEFGDNDDHKKCGSESGKQSSAKSLESLPYNAHSEDPFVSIFYDDRKDDIFGTTLNEPTRVPTQEFASTSTQDFPETSHDMDLLSMTMSGMAVHGTNGAGSMNRQESSFNNIGQSLLHPGVGSRIQPGLNMATSCGVGGDAQMNAPVMGKTNNSRSLLLAFDHLSDGTGAPTSIHTQPQFPQKHISLQASLSEMPPVPPPSDLPPPPPSLLGNATGEVSQWISKEENQTHNTRSSYPDELNPFSSY